MGDYVNNFGIHHGYKRINTLWKTHSFFATSSAINRCFKQRLFSTHGKIHCVDTVRGMYIGIRCKLLLCIVLKILNCVNGFVCLRN